MYIDIRYTHIFITLNKTKLNKIKLNKHTLTNAGAEGSQPKP